MDLREDPSLRCNHGNLCHHYREDGPAGRLVGAIRWDPGRGSWIAESFGGRPLGDRLGEFPSRDAAYSALVAATSPDPKEAA